MNGPRRLLEQPGPSARLLRAADIHVPSEQARRRALLAAGSAAATLAASGSSAALGSAALLKTALIWLSAGMLSGAAITVVVAKALPLRSPVLRQPAPATTPHLSGPSRPTGEAPTSSSVSGQVELESSDRNPAPAPAGMQSARESSTGEAAIASAARAAASVPSLIRFTNEGPASPSLFDELRLIDGARTAAATHDARAVLAIVDHYDSAYPRGQFLSESLALRIETLARTGDRVQAQALAARFRRDYPHHPLLARVGAAVGN